MNTNVRQAWLCRTLCIAAACLAGMVVPANTALAQVGACCLCQGQCIDPTSPTQCQALGGIFFPNQSCLQIECREWGACCLPSGVCVDQTFFDLCSQQDGQFFPCQDCADVPCGTTPQACCFCDGGCGNLLPADCIAAGGTPRGPGTTCATVQCLPVGACCFLDIAGGPTCVDDVSILDCPTFGAVFYPCQTCAEVPCGEEACCFCDGLCAVIPVPDCTAAGGTPQGPGSACATIVCPRIGACCIGGQCVDTVTAQDCGAQAGQFFLCTPCAQVTCEPVGACCFTCQPPGPTPPCPDPTPAGPPCIDGVTKTTCEQFLHGVYRGDGTACLAPTGLPLCRCRADLNGDGVTNAADFTILAGAFGAGIPNCVLHTQGDLNCDGIVNAADFTVLAGDFGCQ